MKEKRTDIEISGCAVTPAVTGSMAIVDIRVELLNHFAKRRQLLLIADVTDAQESFIATASCEVAISGCGRKEATLCAAYQLPSMLQHNALPQMHGLRILLRECGCTLCVLTQRFPVQ